MVGIGLVGEYGHHIHDREESFFVVGIPSRANAALAKGWILSNDIFCCHILKVGTDDYSISSG